MNHSTMFPSRFTCLLPLAALALAACTVGPDYHGAPDVASDAAKSGAFVRAPARGVVATHAPAAW
jgi:hypothetical protein